MHQIKQYLRKWWENFTMSDEERYLNESVDTADLERRLKNLINHNRPTLTGA